MHTSTGINRFFTGPGNPINTYKAAVVSHRKINEYGLKHAERGAEPSPRRGIDLEPLVLPSLREGRTRAFSHRPITPE
jgi:hypothetical protein